MKFGSLFSGIGGLDLGLERANMECAWQVEINDFATRVLEKHWPNVARYRDVRECGSHNLEPVDLVCGGFPCQPHSLAGKRRASADERDLWGEFARIIRELKPRWVVAENVPGLLSSEGGRFFGRVLRDLAACGYDAEWQVLPASAFGAWHRRDRVFIVAYIDNAGNGTSRHGTYNEWTQKDERRGQGSQHWTSRFCEVTPYANGREQGRRVIAERGQNQRDADASGDGPQGGMADAEGRHRYAMWRKWAQGDATGHGTGAWTWAIEPSVGRVADGVSRRVDRLRCLGNAVVPQVAEYVGQLIMECDA